MANNGVKITFVGLEKLLAKFDRRANINLVNIINQSTAIVQAQAKMLAPVDTGALRVSIHSKPAEKKGGKVTGVVFTNKEYAPFVEFGTGVRGNGSYPYTPTDGQPTYGERAGQLAQPFMYPAAEMSKPKIKKLMADEVRKELLK